MDKKDLLSLRLACRGFDGVLVPYIYQMLVQEAQSRNGTHLHRAAAICYDLAIQRLLIAGILVNCRDGVGETALHVAARNNCLIMRTEIPVVGFRATREAEQRKGWAWL